MRPMPNPIKLDKYESGRAITLAFSIESLLQEARYKLKLSTGDLNTTVHISQRLTAPGCLSYCYNSLCWAKTSHKDALKRLKGSCFRYKVHTDEICKETKTTMGELKKINPVFYLTWFLCQATYHTDKAALYAAQHFSILEQDRQYE